MSAPASIGTLSIEGKISIASACQNGFIAAVAVFKKVTTAPLAGVAVTF